VITGDLIDFSGITRDQLRALGTFDAPCFFAIGNHERYVDLTAICERLRSLGVRVLRNEAALAGPFQIIGIDDVDKPTTVAKTIETIGVARDRYSVLLYHRPDGFDSAAEHDVKLMLAGHTHAGQIIPFNFIVKKVYPRLRGLYREGESLMYVSPGTGTWGPILRFGSRSEITRFVFE
jgi:predicted MPP superfamily phosphohydrolase